MGEQAAFFSPYEAPPGFVPPPSDDALAQRISKLATYAARNGPGFVDMMRTKQAGNAEYNFLSGGEGSAYWRWILYCTLYNLPPGTLHTSLDASYEVHVTYETSDHHLSW